MKPQKPLTFLLLLLVPCAEIPAQGSDDPAVLAWNPCRALRDVRDVFSHPTDPLIAWVAASEGLLKTEDEGQTWQAVPPASAEKMGLVTNLIVCPADGNRLIIGTQEKGLFLSGDGGKSFKPLGDEKESPASGHIAYVDFCDSDPSWRTLLATHGPAATGLSVSRDLGETWEVFGKKRFLKSFAKDGDTIVAAGSMVETDAQVWGIHRSGFDGQRWEECNRGIRPGQAALPLLYPLHFLFSTLDGDVLESNDDGRTWYPVAKFGSAAWGSLFFTFGRTDSTEILVGYDPHREGVVLSPRRFRPGSWKARNAGLYVGPFVKSGATCRANANGTTFYVVMNNMLWIGRREASKTGPTVLQAWCSPASMWIQSHRTGKAEGSLHQSIEAVALGVPAQGDVRKIAQAQKTFQDLKAGLTFTVQAKVAHPKGPAALKVVTVDLSILGRSRSAPLYDDGKHADAKARDGLWAGQVPFLPSSFAAPQSGDRRRPPPGRIAFTVTAIDTGGVSDHWSAVLGMYRQPEPVPLWPGGRHLRFSITPSEGPVSVQAAGREGVDGQSDAIAIDAPGPGPWRGAWIMGAAGMNISGRDALEFYIKGDVNQELYAHLVDRYVVGVDAVDVPHYSRPVPLLAGGYLKAITREYQKVRIPIKTLLPHGTLFLRRHAAGMALSVGQGGKPGRYYLDDVRAEP